MKVSLSKIGGRGGRPFACAWLALCLLLVASPPPARSQAEGRESASREQGARPRAGGGGNSLMRRLNLTPEQRTRLREIRGQSEPEARELVRRVRLARRALDDAIYADSADEALVGRRARALSEAQAALLRLRTATELKVRHVLTPEQLQLFRELRSRAQRRRMTQGRRRGAERTLPHDTRDIEPGWADAPAADTTGDPRPQGPPRARGRRP